MKKYSIVQIIVFTVFVICTCFNQAHPADEEFPILPKYFSKLKDETKKSKIEKKISGLLELQIQLRNSYREQPTPERLNLMRKMGMRTKEVDKHLVFIHLKKKLSASRVSALKKIGITVYEDSWIPPLKNHPTGFVIASIPVDRLYDLAKKPFVIRLETAEQKSEPQNDEAAMSIHADSVWSLGYDGSGVKIAVLDSGLDTTHQDIPTPIIGKDYSDPDNIDDTIENLVLSHGTHVTGSVLGRGTLSGGKYKGMAYGADLIFLKIGDDSTGGAATAAISAAIRAAVDVYNANIVTMSYGGFETYNDGSDENCQAVDYAFDKGTLVFMAAGNEADAATHYSDTVTANNTTDYIKVNIDATSQASLYFYLNWFDGKGTSNNLDLTLYDANKTDMSPYVSKFPEVESSRGTEAELVSFNLYVSGPASFFLKVKNNSNSDQFFHIYSFDYYTTFENADTNYTIGSPAVADNAIAVASYTTRNSWTDYKGLSWSASGTIGEISSFSSRGPRIDGTKKPDIATPGERIISARDRIITWPGSDDNYVVDNDGISDGTGPADYLLLRGTSMACPIAAGASALLIQANPSLKGNPSYIRNALFQTASNNGVQNNTDGYGKMEILAALNSVKNVTPSPATSPTPIPTPTITLKGSITGYVVGTKGNPIKSVKIKLKGITTKTLFTTFSDADGFFEFTGLEADTYTIIANKKGYKRSRKTVVLKEGEEREVQIKMKKAKKTVLSVIP